MSEMNSERAEPNLTPLLDMVFQLITFFMLVINFSSENYDARVLTPIHDERVCTMQYDIVAIAGIELHERSRPSTRLGHPAIIYRNSNTALSPIVSK